jgi:hypothetical protein
MTTNMIVMPVNERMRHRPEDWGFHCEQLGQYKAPHCTVFLRNNDGVETTRNLFLGKNLDAKRKIEKKFARSLSMA